MIMKKSFYILSAALLVIAACSKEVQEPVSVGEPLPEGTMVKTSFSVSFPKDVIVETRALAETPDLENLYVAVFGSTELQYWLPATLKSKPSDSNPYVAETEYEYEVELPISNTPLQLHFIGNVPDEYTGENAKIPTFGGSTEESVMTEMKTKDAKGGYWQKVKVDYIKATKNTSTNTISMDYGAGISLSHIALVRNYAKLRYQVTDKEDFHTEFTLLGYTLINTPTMAYIAPWQSGLRYDNRYTSIAGATDFYHNLLSDGYSGYTPAGSIQTSKLIADQPERTANALEDVYMYERPVPDGSNQTAVIAKIQWKPKWVGTGDPEDPDQYILPTDEEGNDNPNYSNGVAGNTYYYKIELTDSDDQYFPILRNIWYVIKLESLQGPGSDSYENALQGPYFGNVSSSMEAANLNEITDNQTKLWVNKTDFLNLVEKSVDINFRYYPEAGSSSYVTNAYMQTPESSNPYVFVEVLTVKNAQGHEYASAIDKKTVDDKLVDDITIGTDGKITVKCVAPDPNGVEIYRSKIRLTGVTSGKRKLYREVTITVMPVQDLTSDTELISETDEDGKKNITVRIGLPPELSYDIFPLTFKIEAENNNLSTNDSKLPVNFGPSAFRDGKNSYYFIKTITWAEYCKIVNGEYRYEPYFDCELFATDSETVSVKVTNFTSTTDVYFREKPLQE